MALIVFAGQAGSGKDSAADALVERHNFKRIAMADTLKELCSEVFKIPLKNFHDPAIKDVFFTDKLVIDFTDIDAIRTWLGERGFDVTQEQREAMEQIGHDKKIDSCRHLLIFVGTDLIRNNVHPDIWLNLALDKIKKSEHNVVVTDARFPNERNALKQIGGILCLVKRHGLVNEIKHESENSMGVDSDYDVLFNNVSTLYAFQGDVSMWWTLKRNIIT